MSGVLQTFRAQRFLSVKLYVILSIICYISDFFGTAFVTIDSFWAIYARTAKDPQFGLPMSVLHKRVLLRWKLVNNYWRKWR